MRHKKEKWQYISVNTETIKKMEETKAQLERTLSIKTVVLNTATWILYISVGSIINTFLSFFANYIYYKEKTPISFALILNFILNAALIALLIYLLIPKAREWLIEWGTGFLKLATFVDSSVRVMFSLNTSYLLIYSLYNLTSFQYSRELMYENETLIIMAIQLAIGLAILIATTLILKISIKFLNGKN